jgi:plasmid stabilization system protein ParE
VVAIRWTSEAVAWLRDIHDYIARDNPPAAIRVVEGIYQKVQMLREFPDLGYRYRSGEDGEVRILLYGHYRIAYLRCKLGDFVDVLGVFHGSLDLDRYLP